VEVSDDTWLSTSLLLKNPLSYFRKLLHLALCRSAIQIQTFTNTGRVICGSLTTLYVTLYAIQSNDSIINKQSPVNETEGRGRGLFTVKSRHLPGGTGEDHRPSSQ
jgi:hypothetical protein